MAKDSQEFINSYRAIKHIAMSDWDLTEKHIYKLLRHPYQLDKSVVEDMASAYLEFVEELFDYLNRIGD